MNSHKVIKKTNLPDFIYVGTGKAGSTWLFSVLSQHPSIFLAPVKETNFFDLNFSRGVDWYTKFFREATEGQHIGEIAHRYLREPKTAERIRETLGEVRILIGLREPSEYALSDYLFCKRNGETRKSLDQYVRLEFDSAAINYRKLIEPYERIFGVDSILICDFRELKEDSQQYLDNITDFIGVSKYPLNQDTKQKVNQARSARSQRISAVVSRTSKWLKRKGGQRLIQTVKANGAVQHLLYRDVTDKPKMSEELKLKLILDTKSSVDWIDESFGMDLQKSWYENH